MSQAANVRVLVVDDSPLTRALLRNSLARHPQIQVIGVAGDGVEALAQIRTLRPDVVTLDLEMPRLDGLGVLAQAAEKTPASFVVVSSLTRAGAQHTFAALDAGAADYLTKPPAGDAQGLSLFRDLLVAKVLAAAQARHRPAAPAEPQRAHAAVSAPHLPPGTARGWVVAIGISCGGPQSLHAILPAFPSDFVPIVITQHMPAQFTAPFAQHLDAACAMRVREATNGERLEPGTILIAPGDRHLCVVRAGTELAVRLDDGPPVSGHRPSVNVMLRSVARACGRRAVGVVMTGMGRDGADGVVALADAGAQTIAQDEQSSYVYGMPRAAAQTGRVGRVVPLAQIPATIARLLTGGERPRGAGRDDAVPARP